MLYREIFSLLRRILLIGIFLTGFSVLVFPQGYIVEIQGVWKKSNGAIVKNRQKLSAETRINNVSGQSGDSIFIADANGEIAAFCSNGCRNLVIPNTQSWKEYFWCKIVGCDSTKYIIGATKGDECVNFDGIAAIDQNGITDLSEVLNLFANKSEKLSLKFQRLAANNIEENQYDIKTSNPRIKGLYIGSYDVLEGKLSSRILVLPSRVYEEEKLPFAKIQNKIAHWKEKGLSNCTIKTFTQSYIDYVAEKHKDEFKENKKKTENKA